MVQLILFFTSSWCKKASAAKFKVTMLSSVFCTVISLKVVETSPHGGANKSSKTVLIFLPTAIKITTPDQTAARSRVDQLLWAAQGSRTATTAAAAHVAAAAVLAHVTAAERRAAALAHVEAAECRTSVAGVKQL